MKTLEERQADYKKVSKKIAELGSEDLAAMLKDATQVHSGIGGTAVKLVIEGVPVFAKQIALSDLEMANQGSTANLFNLPTYYQYGVGSAGFGAWRELEAHKMTTNWVLRDECANFPLMYGHAIVPRAIDELTGSELEKQEKIERREKFLQGQQEYWGGSPAVRSRIEAIENASNSLVVFMEDISRSDGLDPRLDRYIHPQASKGDTTKPNMAMVKRELKATCDFMERKGMMHFDAHHGNILTDGNQLYFADFGLATSLNFELSAEEREFVEKNPGYDLSLATAGLSSHPRAESTGEELPILPAVKEVSDRYQAASDRYRAFTKSLREDFTKTTPYPAAEMQALHQQINKKEKPPLVILVGEAGHGDLSYGSLIQQIAQHSEKSGLKFQIFSEFESQSKKMEGCRARPEFGANTPFINKPSQQNLDETIAFLDKNFIHIGIADRQKLIDDRFKEFAEKGLSAKEVVEQIRQENGGNFFMSPKMLETLEPEGMTLDKLKLEWGSPLHYRQIHRKMIEDIREKRDEDVDVVIVVTGFGHIYGMDQKLQQEFANSDRFAITNFMIYLGPADEKERERIRLDEEKFAPVGNHGLISFEIDKQNLAVVPKIITQAIEEKSKEKSEVGWVARLGLKESKQRESFVERV